MIGLLEKDFGRSLLRSHWHVRDAAGEELFEAHEASWIIALVRRFAELGPDWFSLLSWLPFNFVLRAAATRSVVQARAREVPRPLRARARAGLDDVDRRLVVAFAVALDALQDR